jgi:hypothetical protein
MRRTAAWFLALVLACVGLTAHALAAGAATTPPNLAAVRIKLKPIATGLDRPVALAWRRGDSKMYVAEQSGTVRAFTAAGAPLATPVLSLTGLATGYEQGLLGIVFSPDGKKLYTDTTDATGTIQIDEYPFANNVAVTAMKRHILSVPHPGADNHNGGNLQFGPDKMLYMGFGDGGGAGDPDGNAQNLGTLLGKIVRIDPKPSATLPYTIPADNPFVNTPGARGEIWMYGVRNPWRWSFDRLTHDWWLGDVGQDLYEEIDYASAATGAGKGANWEWNLREALHPFNGGARPADGRDPILELPHTDGYCAIIGGYVYRARAVKSLSGAYVYSDNCRSALVGVVLTNGAVSATQDLNVTTGSLSSPSSFGQNNQGQLFVADLTGTVYQLVQG